MSSHDPWGFDSLSDDDWAGNDASSPTPASPRASSPPGEAAASTGQDVDWWGSGSSASPTAPVASSSASPSAPPSRLSRGRLFRGGLTRGSMILLVGAALGFAVFAYLILFSIPSTFRHFDPVSSPWLQVASGVTMATVTAIVFAVITLVLLVIATIRRSSRIFGAIGLTLALIGGTVMIPMSAMRTATAVQFSAQHTVLRLVDKFDWHTLSLPEAEEVAGYFSHLLEHTKISPATLHTYIPDSAWQALPDEAREVLEGVLGARPHTKDG